MCLQQVPFYQSCIQSGSAKLHPSFTSSFSSFTSFRHRAARVAPSLHSAKAPFRSVATLAQPAAQNAGKAVFVFLLRQSIMPGRFYSLSLNIKFIKCFRQYHALRVPFRQPVMLLAAQSSSSRQPSLSCCPASLHFVASSHFIPFSRSAVHRLPIILLACGSLRAAGCHVFCIQGEALDFQRLP